ncbi:hypothetical protein BELL_0080g00200 [Botrytis elliptica]|uniref:Uncharacterized protein n=1 Tax=Botrytis elliptica TaxID=278938 RepID=A0A4Z1JW09_9HELO|nr:hypothetical protein EAE99_007320 [Botrytis elliptica]TGO78071.1 hypothetical protein BELL_0080g00200 [Botrytis elliptica]
MAQPETPASASRNSIISPLAGGMTTAQLEQVLQRTPQMTRFNPLRRHLRAPKTPNSRISKSEIIASDDEAATTSPPAPIVQPPESLTGEAIGDKGKEGSVATGGDNVDQGTSKSIDTLRPSSHENISHSKQLCEPLPKRFLRTIAKRKKFRREQRIASKLATSLLAEEPSSTSSQGKKDDEKAALSRNGSGSPVESNTLFENPDPLNDETSDGSQESTSLEELIRTTSRTHNSQPSSDPEVRDISFSFGAPRLVRNAIMGSHKRDTNNNNLDNLEIDILGLSHATRSSDCTPDPSGSEDAPIDHTSRKGGRPSPKKQQKKRVNKRSRRVPVDELHLVSERVAEFSQETDDENVEPSTEILDDPISQDSSDALKIIQSVGRTKGEKKGFQTYHGAFGKIDNKAFRFPDRYHTSPRAESSNRRELSSSHSDGFVGAEANPTGRCMLLPKKKSACINIWGLTAQVAQLELVREKAHEPVDELNAQAERRVPAEKTKRRLKKKATLSASVMIELESQAKKTGESPQDDQDSQSREDRDANQDDQPMHGYLSGDELISVAEVKSPLPPTRKGSRRVTFDEKVEIDRRVRIPSSDCENLDDSFEVRRRKKSSDSAVWLNMETVRLKRCHDEDSEEDSEDDVLSINESERSVISIASDNDEMEESDGSGYDSDEEMGDEEEDEAEDQNENENENEEESGECFDVLGVHGKQSDESIDGIILSIEDESREENQQGNGKDDDRDDFYASEKDAILNNPVGGEEEITGVFVSEGLVSNKEISPIDELIVQESQTTRTEDNKNSQASQLSITMSLQTTTQALKLPEAGGWRIRKPKPSDVMNETQEDIFDSSSPISTIIKRKSTGLHTRRRITFRSRPLTLTVDRPSTPPSPEIPETQIATPQIPEARLIAVRDISPELGEPQPSNTPGEFDRFILDAPPPTSHGQSLHSSQLSFIPDEIPDETYFCRASQVLEEHKTPMSRSKSTPGRFYIDHFKSIANPTHAQPNTETTGSEASTPRMSPKFSQQSYRPTPRSEKSLSRLTRQASSALGTLPGSARKRTKTLPFKPPFKKPILKI